MPNIRRNWARIFLIPSTVIKKIEGICRNFLWSGNDQFKHPLVAWDICCDHKKHGGLGFLNYADWNKASIAKFTWWIASKQDHLWIKWVNAIYIKHRPWWDYTPSNNSSWAWRQICKIKDVFKAGYCNNEWHIGDYDVQKGYEWLHAASPKVGWWPVVWNRMTVPKHAFILWLYIQNRLSTRDRLCKHGICQETACFLCQHEDETRNHLFFQCDFSKKCLFLVQEWLGITLHGNEPVHWCQKWRCPSLFRKQVVIAGIASLIYHIWHARNKCRMEGVVPHPCYILRSIKASIIGRVQSRLHMCKSGTEFMWLNSIGS